MLAVGGGHLDIVKLLLMYKADPNIKNKEGDTASNYTMKNRRLEVREMLLIGGTNLDQIDDINNTSIPIFSELNDLKTKIRELDNELEKSVLKLSINNITDKIKFGTKLLLVKFNKNGKETSPLSETLKKADKLQAIEILENCQKAGILPTKAQLKINFNARRDNSIFN